MFVTLFMNIALMSLMLSSALDVVVQSSMLILSIFVIRMIVYYSFIHSLSTNFTKWSSTLKQFVGKLPTNCLSVFDHFVGLALKGLMLIFTKEFFLVFQ